jgi:predicted DNA-binding transcriptional regulator AlpA
MNAVAVAEGAPAPAPALRSPNDLVPAEQAATVAGVSVPTLWRAARAGRLHAHRTGPKETRFSVAEARRWGAERTRSRGRRAA